tara:strand:+ start:9235 stop:10059 length:825 start_codon:yes stop_codon:yes gene_type:complete
LRDYFRCEPSQSGIKLKHSSGFFSCCSIAVYNISVFIENESLFPLVDFSETFLKYMGPQSLNGNDVYEQCFQLSDQNNVLLEHTDIMFEKSSLFPYIEENYDAVKVIVDTWFTPNNTVVDIKDALLSKYKINTSKTLCVCFRGTDKYKDIPETQYGTFCSKVNGLMNNKGLDSILVQTDQEQFLDYFRDNFANYKIIVIAENPRRTDQEQVAFMLEIDERIISAQVFLATMLIMSECKYVINHTGNVSRWINLFRGGAFNTIQYMTENEIINID